MGEGGEVNYSVPLFGMETDVHAKFEVEKQFVIPASLHAPIAARNKDSIIRYVGKISKELSRSGTDNAFLVSVSPPLEIDDKLLIWKHTRSVIFHQQQQVWVHVKYSGYRRAYRKAFPEENIDNMVLDHLMNRRVAKIKNYQYTRIVPVSRVVNSSSAYTENWEIKLRNSKPEEYWKNHPKMIQYADLVSLVTMLDILPGGGFMQVINDAQKLIEHFEDETASIEYLKHRNLLM